MERLFLHHGPGGNAALERAWFSAGCAIDFWDQPVLAGQEATFDRLVDACRERAWQRSGTTTAPLHLVGHSFGCDLALAVARCSGAPPIGRLTLLAPLFDLSDAFLALAARLLAAEGGPRNPDALTGAAARLRRAPRDRERFLALAGAVAAEPGGYRYFWSQPRHRERFEELAARLPPLDGTMWQAVIGDFFERAIEPEPVGVKTEIVLGEEDPYGTEADRERWATRFPEARLTVVPAAGHFPHLEGPGL